MSDISSISKKKLRIFSLHFREPIYVFDDSKSFLFHETFPKKLLRWFFRKKWFFTHYDHKTPKWISIFLMEWETLFSLDFLDNVTQISEWTILFCRKNVIIDKIYFKLGYFGFYTGLIKSVHYFATSAALGPYALIDIFRILRNFEIMLRLWDTFVFWSFMLRFMRYVCHKCPSPNGVLPVLGKPTVLGGITFRTSVWELED